MSIIGHAPCLNCGMENRTVKVNKKDHLYIYCAHPADGGCGGGFTSRSEAGDRLLAAKVQNWKTKEAKDQWLGEQQPAPDPDPQEIDQAEEAGDLEETPLEPENRPDPPPPPPRKATPARKATPPARKQASQPKPGGWTYKAPWE